MAFITLKHLKMLVGGRDGKSRSSPQYNMGIAEALSDEDRQRNYGKDEGGGTITDADEVGTVSGWLLGAIEYTKVATEVLTGFIGPPSTVILSPHVEADDEYYNGTDKMRALEEILNKSFTGVDLKPLLILRLSVHTESEPETYDDSDPDTPNAVTVMSNTPTSVEFAPTLVYYNPPSNLTGHQTRIVAAADVGLPTITIVANLYDFKGDDKKGVEDYLIHSKILKTQKDYEDVFGLTVWRNDKGYDAERRMLLKSFVFSASLDDEKRDDVKVVESDYMKWTGDGSNIDDIDTDHHQNRPSLVWLIWTDPTFGYDMMEYSPVANYCMGGIRRIITLLKHYDPTRGHPCKHCGSQDGIARGGRYCIECGRHPYSDGPPISAKEDEKEQELLRK